MSKQRLKRIRETHRKIFKYNKANWDNIKADLDIIHSDILKTYNTADIDILFMRVGLFIRDQVKYTIISGWNVNYLFNVSTNKIWFSSFLVIYIYIINFASKQWYIQFLDNSDQNKCFSV